MTAKSFTLPLRTAAAIGASVALFAGPVGVATAAPGGDNGHHHCGGNSGQGQGNHCDDQTPPGDNQGSDQGSDEQNGNTGNNDQNPPGDNAGEGQDDQDGNTGGDQDNSGGDQNQGGDNTTPGEDQPGGDQGTGDNQGGNTGGGEDQDNPGGDNAGQDDDQTPPSDNTTGGDQNQGGDNTTPGEDQGNPKPKPGGDGHDSQPPKDEHPGSITIGGGIDLTVVIAPSVTIHFGDVTVNNYTVYQVNNVTVNNIVVNNQQYKEVTVYSVDTDLYYLGYYDENGEFHCTGYYHKDVKTPEQANAALASHDVVKQVPNVEVVTGVNPVADSSFFEDNLAWEVPLGIAIVAVAGYGLVTVIRRHNGGNNGPTSLPGASA
jgi:hypothetical protein